MRSLAFHVVAYVTILGPMVLSAGVVAALAWVVQAGSWPWYLWLILAVPLYFCWLVVYLEISALICRQLGRRHPKPRYAVWGPGRGGESSNARGLVTVTACYRRLVVLTTTPFASLLAQFRYVDLLFLRSYAPSVHVGRNVLNLGRIYDPDLTEIGDNAVLGGHSAVVSHSMVIRHDGATVYVSAPVKIGDRATIGGEARVALGCVIGDDAVLELGAVLEPFTRVPSGEVWGGNPARFLRRRDDLEATGPPSSAATLDALRDRDRAAEPAAGPDAPLRGEIRELVIQTLGIEPGEAPDDLSTATCSLWDSLGQVAVAAAVFDRYGFVVDGADVFRLKSVQDIVSYISGHAGVDDLAAVATGSEPVEPPLSQATLAPQAPPEPDDDVEMLPLLEPQAATRALAAMNGSPPSGTPIRVKIAASFTAQPIEPALKLWGRAFGLDVECRFAGYDQIVQALLDDDESGGPDAGRVTVVLTRPEDLPADPADATAALEEILGAIEEAGSVRPGRDRLLVGTLPPVVSSFAAIDRQQSDVLRNQWRDRLAGVAGIELFDFAQVVERLGTEQARSSSLEVMTRGGYSQRLHQGLAIALVRQIRAAGGRRAKVVALDCDNTLWGGVVGEVGLEELELDADGPGRSFQLFQQYLKRLKDRGLLLVVVSKNEEHDVRAVFADHPEMVLHTEDIAAWKVNWQPKSENLRELAEELNLGLDTFVLVDDDPVARMEVKTRLPDVHVVPLPDDPAAYCETLDRLWLFDGAAPTGVDATRTQKAQEEQSRRRERGSAVSLEDFLARLELKVEVTAAGEQDWPRVAQLTQRTNQFNLSLRRRTLDEVKALATASDVLVLRARDRFGDYGLVGVAVLQPGTEVGCCELETLLMSCRALGRGVEDAFLHGIAAAAAAKGATTLAAAYASGARNGQVTDFLARSGFQEAEPGLWRLSLLELPPLPKHVEFHASNGTSEMVAPDDDERHVTAPATVSASPESFVVFDDADVELFGSASRDRNPLHLSDSYARRTPYGRPVVFGMLGALAALGRLEHDGERAVVALNVEFRQPMFTGVRYRLQVDRSRAGKAQVTIWDGDKLATKIVLTYGTADPIPTATAALASADLSEPIDRALEEIGPGTGVGGSYAPRRPSFDRLLERWNLGSQGLGRDRLAALLWSSYLVGMELPGKRALFWSLDVRFSPDVPGGEAFSYSANVERADVNLEFVDVAAELAADGAPWANARLRAFVRPEPLSVVAPAEPAPAGTQVGRGMVAVVIGGSRGLGAALVQALAMQGYAVLATYWKSREDAERVASSLVDSPGSVEFVQGDAGDEAWCRDVLTSRVAAHGRLDLLVCNAAPAIRPLGLNLDALGRFQEFTATSLALVAAPLAALLEQLSERSGSCVLVSSSYVRSLPADWPHYIAAKSAAEGLIQWAAQKYPEVRFLVARPPRILTDQTNTPEGRLGAMPARDVADAILGRLGASSGDRVEFIETFDDDRLEAGQS
jgi:FkbH-like protein